MVGDGKKHDDGGGGGGVSLPEEIVFDVLARVPAKALCRFRCVCKAWHALLSDPAFVAAQRSHTGPYLVGVFYEARWPPKVQVTDMEGSIIREFEGPVVDIDQYDGTNVLGVHAKLICDLICTNDATIVIDPAAGRARTIRTDNTPRAIGRAAQSGTLKVVSVHGVWPSQSCKVATIMEGGAESPAAWRQRSGPPFMTTWNWNDDSKQWATVVNGVVYVTACPTENEGYAWKSGTNLIAAFDLESEDWKTINGPTFGIKVKPRQVALTELKGTLGLVQCLRKDNDGHYSCANIWRLIDFNGSVWVKEHTIQMPRTWKLTKLLGALDDGRILLLVREIENVRVYARRAVGYHYQDFVAFYNPSTETITKLMDTASVTEPPELPWPTCTCRSPATLGCYA